MIKSTSVDSFNELLASGKITGIKAGILDSLREYGPMTAGEIRARSFPTKQINTINQRMAELDSTGVIQIVGERKCEITGRRVTVWAVSGAEPKTGEVVKKKTRLADALEEIESLRLLGEAYKDRIRKLERELCGILTEEIDSHSLAGSR